MRNQSICWCTLLAKVPNVYMVLWWENLGKPDFVLGLSWLYCFFPVYIMLESFIKYPSQLYITLTLQVKRLVLPWELQEEWCLLTEVDGIFLFSESGCQQQRLGQELTGNLRLVLELCGFGKDMTEWNTKWQRQKPGFPPREGVYLNCLVMD